MGGFREAGWPLGAVQSGAAEAIPEGGLARLYDGYFPDDGMVERRGGSVRKSSSALSPAARWIADKRLAGGQRTVFANSTLLSSLAADDTTLSTVDTNDPITTVAPAVVNGVLYWATGTTTYRLWGGSRKATYSTGTAAPTNGSTTVTGAGTSWLANVDVGMFFTGVGSVGMVASVDSDTQLTLLSPWQGTTGAAGYFLEPTQNGNAGGTIAALGSVANRVLIATGRSLKFGGTGDAWSIWSNVEDFHLLPGPILGIGNIRDTAIVFTTEGTYAIYNMALDLTDANGNPQQRIERINDELTLWGQHGLTNWRGSLIAPMLDGVWTMDAAGPPQKISGDFADAYLAHVRAGNAPGTAAVTNGHYFLPIVNSSGTPQDLLTCRLTPNSAGRAMLWSQYRGYGGSGTIRGVALRVPDSNDTTGRLLGIADDGYILSLRYFEPSSTLKEDGDGTDHILEIQTRAYETGRNRRNWVDQVTVHYTLTDAASDNPTIDLAYAVDGDSTFTAVSGTGSESSGTIAKRTWRINRMARTIQFRLRTANAAATAKFRSIEIKTRDSARP